MLTSLLAGKGVRRPSWWVLTRLGVDMCNTVVLYSLKRHSVAVVGDSLLLNACEMAGGLGTSLWLRLSSKL